METLRKVTGCVSFYHNTYTDLSQIDIRGTKINYFVSDKQGSTLKKNPLKSKWMHLLEERYSAGTSAIVSE